MPSVIITVIMVAFLLSIMMIMKKRICQHKSVSESNAKRPGKCIPSPAKQNEPNQLSVLIPKLQEDNETSLSVDITPVPQNKLRHNSGTQTVDNEFRIPYFCPTHNVLTRQDSRLTPTIEM